MAGFRRSSSRPIGVPPRITLNRPLLPHHQLMIARRHLRRHRDGCPSATRPPPWPSRRGYAAPGSPSDRPRVNTSQPHRRVYAHDQSKKCRWILSYIQPPPLCRELARWPLRARAGDQRLRRAAGEPVAGLPGATGAARAGMGAGAHPCPRRSPRRPWRAIWRARCRRWPAIRRTGWQPPWRGSGRRSWHETPDFPGVHEMRRNIPQS